MVIRMNNSLVLAYLGDAVYELYIRKYLIDNGINDVNKLQSESIKFVSATSQANFLKDIIDNNILSDEEVDIVIKARNHKCNHKPKNCNMITYKKATGFEALIGYLYINNNINRLEEIINYIIKK